MTAVYTLRETSLGLEMKNNEKQPSITFSTEHDKEHAGNYMSELCSSKRRRLGIYKYCFTVLLFPFCNHLL